MILPAALITFVMINVGGILVFSHSLAVTVMKPTL